MKMSWRTLYYINLHFFNKRKIVSIVSKVEFSWGPKGNKVELFFLSLLPSAFYLFILFLILLLLLLLLFCVQEIEKLFRGATKLSRTHVFFCLILFPETESLQSTAVGPTLPFNFKHVSRLYYFDPLSFKLYLDQVGGCKFIPNINNCRIN